MWVIERKRESIDKFNSIISTSWDNLGENEYFIYQEQKNKKEKRKRNHCKFCKEIQNLGKGKCICCLEMNYRIIYKCKNPLVIAKSQDYNEIKSHWNEVKDNMTPLLDMLTQDNNDNNNNNNNEDKIQQKSLLGDLIEHLLLDNNEEEEEKELEKPKELSKDVDDFVKLKIASYIHDNSIIEKQISKLLDKEYFKSIFPSFSPTEEIQHIEECSFWQHAYHCGVFCITQNFFYFVDCNIQRTLSLPLTAIDNIKRFRTDHFDSITIKPQSYDNFSIVQLDNTFNTFTIVKSFWMNAVKQSIQIHSNIIQKAKFEVQSLNSKELDKTIKIRKSRKKTNSCKVELLPLERMKSTQSVDSVYINNKLLEIDQDIYLQPLFCNPALEILIQADCLLFRSKRKDAKQRKGSLEVSYRSIHFVSDDNEYVVTMPFIDIDKISRKKDTIRIILKIKSSRNIFIKFDESDYAPIVSQLHKAFDKEESIYKLSEEPTDNLWKEKQSFLAPYINIKQDNELLGHYKNYFDYFGRGSTIIRTKNLFKLILGGIPNTLRPMMWQVISGSYYMKINDGLPYSHYLEKARNCKKSDPNTKFVYEHLQYVDEIKRDIHRTLPEHPFYNENNKGYQSLENVLVAFACKNPAIGYCQGMNIICSLLLLYLNEEDTFFLLSSIVEDILPDYYSKSMIGSLVDLQVLDELVLKYQPHIHKYILESVGGVAIVTVPWVMCLFIRCLPWDITLLALDLILSEGGRAIFLVALAVLQTFEIDILECDGDDLKELLKSHLIKKTNCSINIKASIKHYESIITTKEIQELREKYLPMFIDTNTTYDGDNENIDIPMKESPIQKQEDEEREKIHQQNLLKFEKIIKKNDKIYNSIQNKKHNFHSIKSRDTDSSSNISLTARGRNRTSNRRKVQDTFLIRNSFVEKSRPDNSKLLALKNSGLTASVSIPRINMLKEKESNKQSLVQKLTYSDGALTDRSHLTRNTSIIGMEAFMTMSSPKIERINKTRNRSSTTEFIRRNKNEDSNMNIKET